MAIDSYPPWTLLPFLALVVAIAILPIAIPHAWEKRGFQAMVVALCAVPAAIGALATGHIGELAGAAGSYVSFVTMLGALFVTSGGIQITGDTEPTPRANVCLLLLGSVLASVVGTTAASMLLIRPLLSINRRREHREHLVPLFIMAVANVGGLLTPLGDPPLLVGYVSGVPFFWTLRLLPAWALYVGSCAAALYFIDARSYARETPTAHAGDRADASPFRLRGRRNVGLLLLVVPAALLPGGCREASMVAICIASIALTPRELHESNGFTFAPILDVGLTFAGLFACLGPVQATLCQVAPRLPIQRSWQLFWASGLLSSALDNAPTYTAFAALAKGMSPAGAALVAGISPCKLAAVSLGSVVMGATTYIGNGPNLMIKAIADRALFRPPGFFRYAAFAMAVMLPAHLVTTAVLAVLDR